MLLEITTTHQPATDLGYLLHKHPDKLQTIELSVGQAHVFYPEANEELCTVCLLLDINPVDLVRNTKGKNIFLPEHYVNDRPYTSNSFLSTAIVKAFGSAINGVCHAKPELTTTSIPFQATIYSLKVDCEKQYINKLFEPLGYQVTYDIIPPDSQFPEWGEGKIVNLTLQHTITLKELLSHIYVFIMVLDNDRHYWVSANDVDILVRRGENWLEMHPEKEWITRRYLKNFRLLTSQALQQLTGESELTEPEIVSEKKVNLHQQRLEKAVEVLKKSGAESVLDMGCGEGKLLKLLLKERQFKKITGMDVAFGELQKAKEILHLNDASPALKERLKIFQGSATYKDERLKNYDALALIEVIEHLDEERLPSLEKVVFGFANPETVVISTPNAEYNAIFERPVFTNNFRHEDHRFEWTRAEFETWCSKNSLEYGYDYMIYPVGQEKENVGSPSQLAVFTKK
jgi:3' terminal RNA ribose 2'-O-methyltransferase Hen1